MRRHGLPAGGSRDALPWLGSIGEICLGGACVFDQTLCGPNRVDCPVGIGCHGGYCLGLPATPVVCATATCWTADEICVDGLGCITDPCRPGDDGMACPLDAGHFVDGEIGACCSSTCIDPNANPSNCGNCGIACANGQRCISGVCTSPAPCGDPTNGQWCLLADGDGGTCCDGACTDLGSDSQNCQYCGIECTPGGCTGGACERVGYCPPGTSDVEGFCIRQSCGPDSNGASCSPDGGYGTCCEQRCTYLPADPENCGGCGIGCPSGWTCNGGTCAPVFDCAQAVLPGAMCILTDANVYDLGVCCGGLCVSDEDPQSCGGCGISCPAGGTCTLGDCTADGGAPLRCDDDGGCLPGHDCVAGSCLQTSCAPGFFGDLCAARDRDGGPVRGNCCGGACVDPLTDPANCGGCGNQCAAGTCQDGICDEASCGGPDPMCPAGFGCGTTSDACERVACGPGTQGERCAFGGQPEGQTFPQGYCCTGGCVDLLQDPGNCGECGRICASGVCSFGQCVEPADAGTCLQSCPALSLCVLGRCVDSLCSGAFNSWCAAEDGEVGVCCDFGACADLLTDPANCGLCGARCPGGQTCAGGACSGSPACGPGSIGRGCGFDAGSRTEFCCPGAGCTDTQTDPNNCGFCGFSCESGGCVAGACE